MTRALLSIALPCVVFPPIAILCVVAYADLLPIGSAGRDAVVRELAVLVGVSCVIGPLIVALIVTFVEITPALVRRAEVVLPVAIASPWLTRAGIMRLRARASVDTDDAAPIVPDGLDRVAPTRAALLRESLWTRQCVRACGAQEGLRHAWEFIARPRTDVERDTLAQADVRDDVAVIAALLRENVGCRRARIRPLVHAIDRRLLAISHALARTPRACPYR